MPSVDELVRKAWDAYRDNFYIISIGVILSLLVSIILLYLGTLLLGKDWVVLFLVSSYLFGSVYIASRVSVEPHEFERGSEMLARYILAFSVFTLLVTISYVLPYPLNVILSLLVVSLGYMAVPIVAELGIKDGCKRVKDLIKKVPVSYIGTNWLFFLGFLAIISLFVNPILSVIGFLAVLFFYLPIYSLTAYHLARSARVK